MYLEDVYDLYERTRLVYSKCCSETCEKFNDGTCWCSLRECVQPLHIGEIQTPCKLNRKFYINPGSDGCSICLEKIFMKKDAFITGCGHTFHRSCLFQYYQVRQNQKPLSVLKCPLCRCSLGFPIFLQKYKILGSNINYLDLLENFWLTKDFNIPSYCYNRQCKPHYAGMEKKCAKCRDYIEYG